MSNLLRLHPSLGWDIHTPLPVLPEFSWLQSAGGVETREMYRTFNMGMGMVVAVDANHASAVVDWLQQRMEGVAIVGHVKDHGHRVTHAIEGVEFSITEGRSHRCGHEGEGAGKAMADASGSTERDGRLWMEGKTLVQLSADQERPTHMPRGPAKRTGPGFLNPAMAPARTRSVLLLADALEHDWLVKPDHDLRALDALCATGFVYAGGETKCPPSTSNACESPPTTLTTWRSTGSSLRMTPPTSHPC